MCGIAALVPLTTSVTDQEDLAAVRVMLQSLAHRGPDGEGVRRIAGAGVVLGHRRLAITDLAPSAAQPMGDAEGEIWVTFNGEIYNHREIRASLVAQGCQFRTDHSDTEVLIVGYRRWGVEGLLDRLRGMFAFVLWDERTQELHAVRDRMGIKPLYYAVHDNRLVLSSEIRAISALRGVSSMNAACVPAVLRSLAVPPPFTFTEGVFKLAPGQRLSWSRNAGLRKYRWYDLGSAVSDHRTHADEETGIAALLKEAIRIRVAEDVETSILLSGGLDSGLIAAIAARTGRPIEGFTVGFEDAPELDEVESAQRIARHVGIPHSYVRLSASDCAGYLSQLSQDLDDPIADWACIPLNFVSSLARSHGFKVALVGEGADELFGGYPGWNGYLTDGRWSSLFDQLSASRGGAAADAMLRGAARVLPSAALHSISLIDILAGLARGEGRFLSGAEALRPLLIARAVKPWVLDASAPADPARAVGFGESSSPEIRYGAFAGPVRGAPDRRFARMRARDLSFRIPELLLMRVDKITMRHSLEARVPFLDHLLIEKVLRMRQGWAIEGGGSKPRLREIAAKYLPAETVAQPKIGLGIPADRWFSGALRGPIAQLLSEELDSPGSPFEPEFLQALLRVQNDDRRSWAHLLWPFVSIALWRRSCVR